MLILVLAWLPLGLVFSGLLLLIVRPVILKTGRPLTALARKQLWFWQAVGFWALVIGAFMIGEKVVPGFFPDDDPPKVSG
jgi:hypothetical protein